MKTPEGNLPSGVFSPILSFCLNILLFCLRVLFLSEHPLINRTYPALFMGSENPFCEKFKEKMPLPRQFCENTNHLVDFIRFGLLVSLG